MVKVRTNGLPETVPELPFTSVNVALMVAVTVSPELPLYGQVSVKVLDPPLAAKVPDKASELLVTIPSELVQTPTSEALLVTASVPLRVTATVS